MRYYDKLTRTETDKPSATTLTEAELPWFFKAANPEMHIIYDKDGIPYEAHYSITKPIIKDGKVVEGMTSQEVADKAKEEEKARLRLELDAIVGDLTPAESMYLMLQYGFAKMQPSDAEDDSGVSLTPTGEDIITWGDRIAKELGDKLKEIKGLSNANN